MIQSKKVLPWPNLDQVPIEEVRQILDDIGRLLIESWRALYLDLQALRFAEPVDALPTAGADYRGRLMTLKGGAGVQDELMFCRKNSGDTYEWVTVTVT